MNVKLIDTNCLCIQTINMLQARRSKVPSHDEVDFFNLPNTSNSTMALGSTQPLTEIVPRIFLGAKRRPARMPHNITATCEPNVCGSLDVSKPYRLSRPITGVALPFFLPFMYANYRYSYKRYVKYCYRLLITNIAVTRNVLLSHLTILGQSESVFNKLALTENYTMGLCLQHSELFTTGTKIH
jgi:hypothetical protein